MDSEWLGRVRRDLMNGRYKKLRPILEAAIVLAREPRAACTPNTAEMKLGRLRTAVDNYLGDVPERPSEAVMRLSDGGRRHPRGANIV